MEGLEGPRDFKNSSSVGSLQPVFAGLPTVGTQAPGFRAWDRALQTPPDLGAQSRLMESRPPQSEAPDSGDAGGPEGSVKGTTPRPVGEGWGRPLC